MGRHPTAIAICSSVVASLLIVACASTPPVFESRLTQEYFSSRDGKLRYRAPMGWLTATNEAPSADILIWLVRGDYAATLGVKEIRIDSETRWEIGQTGLNRVAELSLALASGEKGLNVVKQPMVSTLGGTGVCTYEYAIGHSGDLVRVILVNTGGKVFEVSLLMTTKVGETRIADLVSLQEVFVRNVLW